jgi:hypothetical protein
MTNDRRLVRWRIRRADWINGDCRRHVAHVQAGDELKFGRPQIGCRCWLAISGGIDVPVVLGVAPPICAPVSADLKGALCVRAITSWDLGVTAFAKLRDSAQKEFPRGRHRTIG